MKAARLLLHALLGLALCGTAVANEQAPQNVLILFIDDLRPELGCYGVDAIQSPHIDKLASSGILFDRAYCQQALCGPSRISMLSGMYPHTTGIMDLWTPLTKVVPDAMTLPRHFHERGYDTYSFGKVYHHFIDDRKHWTKLAPKSPDKYADPDTLKAIEEAKQAAAKDPDKAKDKRFRVKGPAVECLDVKDEAYPDGKTARQAIEALRTREDRPFFMCVGFTKPHLPFAAPKRYWDLYPRDSFAVPEKKGPDAAPSIAFTVWGELRGYQGIPAEGLLDDAMTRKLKHGYAASVSFVDAQVGKVLAELDRLGLRDDTIVVLWGDHGYKLGEYGAWCKHTNFELDTRVPYIVSAPGFARGERSEALVEMVDIFPTLAELTGGSVPDSCDGRSLLPILKDPAQTVRTHALSMYERGSTTGYSLRHDRWRYTEWVNTKTIEVMARELYDHAGSAVADRNLADAPEHRNLVSELSTQLDARGLAGVRPLRKDRK